MIAHVAGVPVDEVLLPVLASGAGAGLLLARALADAPGTGMFDTEHTLTVV